MKTKVLNHEITDVEFTHNPDYLTYKADGESKWAQGEFYQSPDGKYHHSHIFDDGVEVEFEF